MRILLLLLSFSLISTIHAEGFIALRDTTDPGLFKQGVVPAKMLAARHEFLESNIRGALAIYREILQIEPENAQAHYKTAECYYRLKRYDLAYEYLEDAVSLDSNVSKEKQFFRGQIYHRLAELDKAIAAFEEYLSTDPGKRSLEFELCNRYIKQCQYAKEMMDKPADVAIEHMDRAVNSRYDDYTPSITADGKYLVFTSRRSDTEGGDIDEGGDYKFFEDIYLSTWNQEYQEWDQAIGLPGEVNTPGYDAVLSISPSGDELFVYKNNINSAGDIFRSSLNRNSMEWRAAEKLPRPINTSYFEASVSITADGSRLFFISERPGGLGQGDIWISKKEGNEWSKPENIGDLINTELDEKFVFIHPNGKTLFFASNGHQTMGSYDIFKSELVNGRWSVPINLGYPINTVNEESTFSLTEDNQTMFIAAEYDDSYGERDIYKVDVSDYEFLSRGYGSNSFGLIICTVYESGKTSRKAEVEIIHPVSGRVIIKEETDRGGQVKLNLQADREYLVRVLNDGESKEKTINLPLNSEKPEVVKLDFEY